MRRVSTMLLCVALGAPSIARAQSSPIVDLMLRARVALNDLHYAEADSLANTLLVAFGDRLTHDQRIDAFGVRAAAAYPDPAGGGAQRPETAMVYLQEIVRADPSMMRLRQDITWAGLDTLFASARQHTFASAARLQSEYAITGPAGEAQIEVFATRPARFTLAVMPANRSASLFSDSAGPAEHASLRLKGFSGDRPFEPGSFVVEVVARDTASADAVTLRYPMTVAGLSLVLVPAPGALDSTQIRPEIAPPARARGILAGLLLGGGAVAASIIRGPEPLASASADSRAFLLGGGMALGAVIGGLLDKGRHLPENVAANARLRSAFAESVQQVGAENRRRIAAHRVTITLGEAR